LSFALWGSHRPYRRKILKRFPYVVFFRAESDTIEVVAVAHAKRRPGFWLARLPRPEGPLVPLRGRRARSSACLDLRGSEDDHGDVVSTVLATATDLGDHHRAKRAAPMVRQARLRYRSGLVRLPARARGSEREQYGDRGAHAQLYGCRRRSAIHVVQEMGRPDVARTTRGPADVQGLFVPVHAMP